MKSVMFILLVAIALVGLAACAPGTTPVVSPTTAAQALGTATAVIGQAPTLLGTPTGPATETTAATSAATTAATSAATTAATSLATSAATPAATSAATTAATTEATSMATSAATSVPGGTPTGQVTAAAPTGAAAGPAPAQTITIVGTEFKFDPNQITIKAGQRVRIVFQNKGTVDHELEVEDLKADNVVLDLSQAGSIPEDQRDETMGDAQNGMLHPYAAAGGTATIDFTPTTPGTFDFACNLPGHKEAGMTGTITVTP